MQPIAVLLAACEGERYLGEMLASLQRQSYSNFICYIHDDGSKDATREVIRHFCEQDPQHFRELHGPVQGGAKENFLWMLGQVEAQIYMFADQDDVWLPQKMEKSLAALLGKKTLRDCAEENEIKKLCVFTDMYVTDEALHITAQSFIRHIGRDPFRTRIEQVVIDNPAAGCTMMFTRQLRDMALQLQNPRKIEMHDVWLLALAAASGRECVTVIDEPLVYYRQHANNEKGASAERFYGKIKRNISDLLSGRMAEKKRMFIRSARELAEQVCRVDGISDASGELLKAFSEIGNRGKAERIAFYCKNGFTRKSAGSTIWMFFWV